MAQNSGFWDTNGTGDGAAAYTETEWYVFFRALFLSDSTNEGALKNYLNGLAVSGVTSPLSVATGGAVVAGLWYVNDAATTIAVPTPSGATRIDRIVLQADWTAQTVRVARVAGAEGGAAPALTQTLGTTWEVALAQASITTGGVITVTDERTYAHFNTEVETAMIADNAVTNAKLADDAVDTAEIADAAVETAQLADDAVTNAKLADDAVNTTQLVNDAVTNDKLANITRGSIKVGGAADAPTDLAAKTSGNILVGDGTDLKSVAVSGDVTLAANGAVTIANDAVETVMITDGAVTAAKLGSGILQQRVLMISQTPIAITVVGNVYPDRYGTIVYLDKDKYPSNAVFRLFCYMDPKLTVQSFVKLTRADTGVDISGSGIVGSASGVKFLISSAFTLSAGNAPYTIQVSRSNFGTDATLYCAGLLIEW